MGLDMYLYKIKKPYIPKNEIITREWIEKNNCLFFTKNDMDSIYYKQIKPFTKSCQINLEFIDIEQIAADNHIEDNILEWYNDEIIPDFKTFCFLLEDKREKRVTVTTKEIEEKYSLFKKEKVYIYHEEEIYYWRKCNDMQKFIHKLFDGQIENCEYVRLTMEQVNKIHEYERKLNKRNFKIEKPNNDFAYYYYEWY